MGSPCGACKFLRRKCASDCVFAPYFNNDEGPAQFAAIHKVFGASNAAKMLSNVPQPDRCEAVVAIAYEAQARIHDPVYGCVSHIFALQQQVASLQSQLIKAKAQVARVTVGSTKPVENIIYHQDPLLQYGQSQSMSPQSSVDCDDFSAQIWSKRWAVPHEDQSGELQDLAFRMMRN